MLGDCLSRPLSSLKNTADSVYKGLDIKFIKEEILYLIKVYNRPVIKEFKQSLSSRNISKPQHHTKTTY